MKKTYVLQFIIVTLAVFVAAGTAEAKSRVETKAIDAVVDSVTVFTADAVADVRGHVIDVDPIGDGFERYTIKLEDGSTREIYARKGTFKVGNPVTLPE